MRRAAIYGLLACVTLAIVAVRADLRREPPPPQAVSRADIFLAADLLDVVEARVPPNATLRSLLRAHEVSEDLAERLVDAVRGAFDLRRLRVDQPYRLVRTMDGMVREFVYEIDADRFLRVVGLEASSPEQPFDVAVVPYEKQRGLVSLRGTIDREHPSLVAAMGAAGENALLAMNLADVFGGDIDFNNDLQPGDSFEVVFEKQVSEGGFAGYGPIVAAEFRTEGRTLRAFRFASAEGRASYYDEQGRSLRRFFLRSPLKFEPRISSRFSYRRSHPVLGVTRAHPAVDYAAPVGTPVVAAGAGVVVRAGYSGGAGNMVTLRHSNGYESNYLHLSSIARGVRPGARISQGEVIGRVGATGLATGPHLDYRLKRNGTWVNPLVEHRRMPPGDPITADLFPEFERVRDRWRALFFEPQVAVASSTANPPAAAPASH
jgi:murein DD-endopeptidase MepM/ murein hydrolase activator NlpD